MKKKILFIVSNLKVGGGTERVISLIGDELDKKQDFEILTFYDFENEYKTGCKRTNFKFTYSKNPLLRIIKLMFIIPFYINSFLKKKDFDIVVSHSEDANIASLLVKWYFWKKINLWTTKHNNLDSSIYRFVGFLHSKANKIITVSDQLRLKYEKNFPSKTVKAIHNPLDFSHIKELEDKQMNEDVEEFIGDSRFLLNVGRLSRQKNHPFLLEVFKEVRKTHKDIKLVIFGEGPDKERIQNIVDKNNLQNDVLLAGITNNVFKYYKNCDLFVLSSRFEGFPMVLLEALSVGATIISNDCPTGPREILAGNPRLRIKRFKEAKYGYLVPFNNKKEFVKGIKQLLENPQNKKSIYKKRAKEFSVENIVKNWEKEFDKK